MKFVGTYYNDIIDNSEENRYLEADSIEDAIDYMWDNLGDYILAHQHLALIGREDDELTPLEIENVYMCFGEICGADVREATEIEIETISPWRKI